MINKQHRQHIKEEMEASILKKLPRLPLFSSLFSYTLFFFYEVKA